MAGKFRGDVGKLSKPKRSKAALKAKGRKVTSLVKRAPRWKDEALKSRLAELASGAESILVAKAPVAGQPTKKPIGKATIEIVGKKRELVVPEEDVAAVRTPAEAIGLRMLHQAVRNQSHNRLLPHQNRHDYEYRLRSVATMGVVQLFNSLAQARKASSAVEAENVNLTEDKTTEKKEVVSKEAFLAALRQPMKPQRY